MTDRNGKPDNSISPGVERTHRKRTWDAGQDVTASGPTPSGAFPACPCWTRGPGEVMAGRCLPLYLDINTYGNCLLTCLSPPTPPPVTPAGHTCPPTGSLGSRAPAHPQGPSWRWVHCILSQPRLGLFTPLLGSPWLHRLPSKAKPPLLYSSLFYSRALIFQMFYQ